jgi:hypothetical protein
VRRPPLERTEAWILYYLAYKETRFREMFASNVLIILCI